MFFLAHSQSLLLVHVCDWMCSYCFWAFFSNLIYLVVHRVTWCGKGSEETLEHRRWSRQCSYPFQFLLSPFSCFLRNCQSQSTCRCQHNCIIKTHSLFCHTEPFHQVADLPTDQFVHVSVKGGMSHIPICGVWRHSNITNSKMSWGKNPGVIIGLR